MTLDQNAEMTIVRAGGVETVTILAGTQIVQIDSAVLDRIAIADFLKKAVISKNITVEARDELFGAALGYFGVQLVDLYPDLKDVYELNDKTLAAYTRWQHRREMDDANDTTD